jgi:hypothetical protein
MYILEDVYKTTAHPLKREDLEEENPIVMTLRPQNFVSDIKVSRV